MMRARVGCLILTAALAGCAAKESAQPEPEGPTITMTETERPTVDPESVKDPFAKGDAHYVKGDYAKAEALYDLALEREPGTVDALMHRGCARTQLGKFKEALEDLDRVLDLEPSMATTTTWDSIGMNDVHEQRAKCRMGLKEYKEAVLDYSLSLGLTEHGAKYADRARARELAGDKAGALEDYEKALEMGVAKITVDTFGPGDTQKEKSVEEEIARLRRELGR